MSEAFWAYGSVIQLSDSGSAGNFASIAEVKDITPPEQSRDSIKVTSGASPSGRHEYIPGFRDGGEVSFICNWLPNDSTQDEFTGLLSTFNDDDLHWWKIVATDAIITLLFEGFLTGFAPKLPLEAQGELELKLKVSGDITVS